MIEITEDNCEVTRFECSEEEGRGVLKYLGRYPWIGAVSLVRIYLMHHRMGTDLNTLPMPQPSDEQLGLARSRR
jgi:hypothetical protein